MEALLTRNEQIFVEGILNPVVFFDNFIPVIHKDIKLARGYQIPLLLDNSVQSVTKAGRKTGKTVSLESDILKTIHENPRSEGLLTTPNEAHIDPLWSRLTTFIRSDQYWNEFIGKGRLVKSPQYTMEAKNGFILHGRISGTSKGTGLLSLHVNFVWVDESQLYMGTGLDQLQGCMKENCRVRIFGVPNGIRKGYLSIAWNDPKIPSFSKHKITRYQDPTFTKDEEDRLIRIYGGKNSQSFLNQVLAEDGVSTRKTFNPMYYNKCFVKLDEYEIFEYDGRKIAEDKIKETELDLPLAPIKKVKISVSADLAFHPDPTIIGIWYDDDDDRAFLLCKIILYNITYTRQAEFIDNIAKMCGAENVAVDIGGPGQTVYLDLVNQNRFPGRQYFTIPIDFRTNVTIGTKTVKDDHGYPTSEVVKENAKYYSTVMIEDGFEKKKIMLPIQDLELFDEIDSSTKFETSKGTFSYAGVDHHLDMIRCKSLIKFLSKDAKSSTQEGVAEWVEF